jgi:transposase-like protein
MRVARVRDSSYFPTLLEPRTRAERAVVAVIQEAYAQAVSTRRVDALVQALGLTGISMSQVSRPDGSGRTQWWPPAAAAGWRGRTSIGGWTRPSSRTAGTVRDGKVVIAAVVIAVRASGERAVLGFDVRPSEDGEFWRGFLRALVARGLTGVQLAVGDAHPGRKAAIAAVLVGASWQLSPRSAGDGHVVRNALALVPKGMQPLVASTIRTVFAQPDAAAAREQWRRVTDGFCQRWPAWQGSWTRPRRACSPTSPSRPSTGARSGAPTRWNDATRR